MKNLPVELTIHVVDPDSTVHREIRSLEPFLGARVRVYRSGEEFLRSPAPDPGCLVVESLLPDMAGLDVLRQARGRDSSFPVLMTSNDGSIATATSALRAGADDFLEKPFVERFLVHRLRRLLRRANGFRADLPFSEGAA